MRNGKQLLLIFVALLLVAASRAQLQTAYLWSKGYASAGGGISITTAYPLCGADFITTTGGFNVFHQVLTATPLTVGYRHFFAAGNKGPYAEPRAGYTFVANDIVPDSSAKVKNQMIEPPGGGLSGGLVMGYVFPGKLALNIGLGYEHVFAGAGPSANILSLNIAHTIICGKKKQVGE